MTRISRIRGIRMTRISRIWGPETTDKHGSHGFGGSGGRRVSRIRAYAALALAVAGITWSAIFVRWADVPGPVSAFYRVVIAGVVLITWRGIRGGTRPVAPRAAWIAVAGGVFFALDLALWNTALLKTQAAVA